MKERGWKVQAAYYTLDHCGRACSPLNKTNPGNDRKQKYFFATDVINRTQMAKVDDEIAA